MKSVIENKVKIGIVDDNEIFCDGLNAFLSQDETIEVVVTANSGKEILSKLKLEKNIPDILLLDIRMSGIDGIELLKSIKESYSKLKVIMFSMHTELVIIEKVVNLGADGYIRKCGTSKDIFEAIRLVSNNGFFLDKSIIKELKKYRAENGHINNSDLSKKEIEVLKLICQQYSTKQIADKLCLTNKSIEYHRKNLMKKTNSNNVVGLVLYAIKNNFYSL